MYKIGLTGGIGAGKSAASAYIGRLGIPVLDADRAAREVVEPQTKGYEQIVQAFGSGILLDDGTLNRKKLGQVVFSDSARRETLNAIVHPLVEQWFEGALCALAQKQTPLVVLDVPLLIECGWHEFVDEVWLVAADDEKRIERIEQRDGCTEQEALARISSQLSQAEKKRYATRILDNNGTLGELYSQIDAALAACVKKG